MMREGLDDVEYKKTLCVRGQQTQYFGSAIVEDANYLHVWLIFRQYKFS